MASGTFYPAANGDDGYNSGGGSFYNTGDMWFGPYPRMFVRFTNVTIPAGATIDTAYIKFKSTDYSHGDVQSLDLYFEDADDPSAPSDSADLNSRTLTTATIEWNPGTWSTDTWYNSASLTGPLQEVIDRAGWASGQDVLFIATAAASGYNSFYAYDEGINYPELYVEWTPASPTYDESISDSFSVSEGVSESGGGDLTLTETFTLDDTHERAFEEEITDSFSLDDAAVDVLATVYTESVPDSFSMSETLGGTQFIAEPVAETFSLDDTLSSELIIMCDLDPYWELPPFSLEAEGEGWYISFESTLPSFSGSATGDTATVCLVDTEASLPAMTCEAYAGAYLDTQLWTPYQILLSANATIGDTGSLTKSLPSLTLSAYGYAEQTAQATLTLPRLRFTGTMVHDVTADLAILLRKPILSAYAYTGDTGDASLTIPVITLDGTGYQDAHGDLAIDLPGLWLVAHANGGDTGYYVVPVMNTRNFAVSEWGMGINSVAQFNGKTVVTDGTSIYEITGTTDDLLSADDEIVCNIKTGNLDLANWSQMRLTDAYLNIKSTGDVKFYFELDEGSSYEFDVTMHDLVDTHQEKVNLGKGMKARVYAVSLFNVDGSVFHLNKLQFIGHRLD